MDIGRPTLYTQEIADYICAEIVGGRSLRDICRNDGELGVPHVATVLRWVSARKDFREQYTLAREAQVDAFYDDLTEIADDGTNDWMERETKKGNIITVANHEHISRSKLRVDVRMWALSKMQPKKYGQKTFGEITGKDGAPIGGAMSDAQIAAALNAMMTNQPLPATPEPQIAATPEPQIAATPDDITDLV
jgi:hypothetical protein